jgi:hypothetical protein
MNNQFARFIVLSVLSLTWVLSGCTSMRLVEDTGSPAPYAALRVGDDIRVRDTAGVSTDLEVTMIGSDFIEGTNKKDQVVRVALTDVRELRQRRVAWGKTAGLALGVCYVLCAAAATAAAASIL